jgi:hypothetical protein
MKTKGRRWAELSNGHICLIDTFKVDYGTEYTFKGLGILMFMVLMKIIKVIKQAPIISSNSRLKKQVLSNYLKTQISTSEILYL